MNAISQKAKEIFVSLVDGIAEGEREKRADEACQGDVELKRRVHALLLAHAQPDSRIEHAALDFPVTVEHSIQITEKLGTLIGRYKLLEQVGEGGMGIVFVAEQTEPVRRRVALKIIKPGMDTKQVIARFEAERQALAMMDHPNIARVLDAGTTEVGRPYFVMELVRGMPITEYCDKARLSPRQRLELFVDVCQAVQHAHQKGIIHRDLKPSNVMITLHDGTPVVKVIDFGVAKAVGQQLTDRTIYTALTQLVGTPLYMSPEQAEMSGLDVDTRSDVYSLGVLLYELLTGQTPFDKETLSKAGLDEMRRIIREDEPLRPSHRVSTLNAEASSTISQHRSLDERRLSKILCGELDWIVMKALEKDRSRRYESASALATDIQRYLSDEPVLACPPTTMYRFQKFARKHKPALATAAAIALCLILGTTVSAWQAVRATTAEAQANTNEAQAQVSAQEAKEQAKEATTQRDEAQKQRDEVKALNEKLLATQQQLQRTLYAAQMNVAHNAWSTSGVGRVQELLTQYHPKPGETDLRGFEWHFLERLCHADLLTLKHPRDVLGVAFSPDGKRLASSCGDGTLRLWDPRTGQETLVIKNAGGWIRSVAFSPDGARLACLSHGNIRVWDAQTGQRVLNLDGASAGSLSSTVMFSPDGKRLANDGRVWDAQTGQKLLTLTLDGQREFRRPMVYSPDGKRIATGGGIRLWDAETGKVLLTIGHTQADTLAFSPDGKRLATCYRTWGMSSDDVKIRDSQTGQELLSIKVNNSEGISSLAFSPDGNHLAGGSWDQTVKVWDAQTGQQLATFKGHTGVIDTVAYSLDGQFLASASRDKTVKVWRAQELTTREARTLRPNIRPNRGPDRVWDVAFSPDGQHLASGSLTAGQSIRVWDAKTGKDVLSLDGHTRMVRSVAYSPDGKRLASGSSDSLVKLWDAQTGKELRTFSGHTDAVVTVAFSPDGNRLASASWDKTVKVWNVQTGEAIMTLQASPKTVATSTNLSEAARGVAFSPDGKRIASGGSGYVKIWDSQTGQELLTMKDLQPFISVAFSPDSTRLASCGHLGSGARAEVKVWDAQTGQELLTLKGGAYKVVYSPDGTRLASGSFDGTVKMWDAQTGRDTLTLEEHTDHVCNVAFSPDGHRLASNGPDGTVRIWDATPLPEKP